MAAAAASLRMSSGKASANTTSELRVEALKIYRVARWAVGAAGVPRANRAAVPRDRIQLIAVPALFVQLLGVAQGTLVGRKWFYARHLMMPHGNVNRQWHTGKKC